MKKMKRMRGGGMTGGSASKGTASKGGTTARGPGGSMAASKANAAGNRSGVGGGGGGGGGASGNRGSSVGARVGANSGSQPKGAGNRSGVGGGGGGGGGKFGSRGSSVGAPVGKKSGTQAPAARPSRSLGGTNPMGSQGTSFRNTAAAQKFNRNVTKEGFGNRLLKNAQMGKISAVGDIEDRRRMMGPFNTLDPKYTDDWGPFDPNKPMTRADLNKMKRDSFDSFEGAMRNATSLGKKRDAMTTPQEIRERARAAIERSDQRLGEAVNRMAKQRGAMTPVRDPMASFKRDVALPDAALPSRRSAISSLADSMAEGYRSLRDAYGDALYGPRDPGTGFRKGGLVKKTKKK